MLWHCQLNDPTADNGGVVRQNSRQERRRQRKRPLCLGQFAISRWACGMRSDVVFRDAQAGAEVVFLLLDRRRHVGLLVCRKQSKTDHDLADVVSKVRRQQRANGRDQVWSSTSDRIPHHPCTQPRKVGKARHTRRHRPGQDIEHSLSPCWVCFRYTIFTVLRYPLASYILTFRYPLSGQYSP